MAMNVARSVSDTTQYAPALRARSVPFADKRRRREVDSPAAVAASASESRRSRSPGCPTSYSALAGLTALTICAAAASGSSCSQIRMTVQPAALSSASTKESRSRFRSILVPQ